MRQKAKRMLRHAFGVALDDEELETLYEAATVRHFSAGEVVLRQGEAGDAFYVITMGHASVSQQLDENEELLLGEIGPGQYVGELALLDQAPRMATCRAITPLEALQYEQAVFSDLMDRHAAVANAVLLHVLRNMRDQDRLIIEELSRKNEALSRALSELRAAQAELLVKERLEHELALAAEAQRSLLPDSLPPMPPYYFAGFQEPARQVGGDLYDVIALDEEHVGLLLADVADKGLHAALIMAVAHTLFRTEARRSLSPAAVATAVHQGLLDLDRAQETFLTAFYGVLHRPSGRLTYIRAAQEKPLLLRRGEGVHTLEGGDRFLGMLPDLALAEHQAALRKGDRLLLFSDGVPDAANAAGEAFGYARLGRVYARGQVLTAARLVQMLVAEVRQWTGSAEPFDDITVLALAVDGLESSAQGVHNG